MDIRLVDQCPAAAASATVVACGAARAGLAELPRLRKTLPAWAPADTPGHFLKYADEQTLVAVQAVDRAVQARPGLLAGACDRGIVVAARYPGRLAAAATLERFGREGSPSVSPHIVPQHSLHSVSGALSILLSLRGPNVGVGGGPKALDDGLLAALTLFDARATSNWWFVSTGWDPEPVPREDGRPGTDATCFAAAFALSASEMAGCGRLTLAQRSVSTECSNSPNDPAGLARALLAANEQGRALRFRWNLGSGDAIELAVDKPASALPAAA